MIDKTIWKKSWHQLDHVGSQRQGYTQFDKLVVRTVLMDGTTDDAVMVVQTSLDASGYRWVIELWREADMFYMGPDAKAVPVARWDKLDPECTLDDPYMPHALHRLRMQHLLAHFKNEGVELGLRFRTRYEPENSGAFQTA